MSLLSPMYKILSNSVFSRVMLYVKNSVNTRHIMGEDYCLPFLRPSGDFENFNTR